MDKGVFANYNTYTFFIPISQLDTKKGFGFVESDVEYTQDLFISSDNINGAMHNDRVMAEIVVPAT
ncbi:hypothetical protein ACTPEF_26110, partial [Clostridioides difficile]